MSKGSLRQLVHRSRARLLVLLVAGIALVGVGLFTWLWVPRQSTHRLRVTGGVEGLNRHGVAAYLRRHAREIGLEIEVRPSEGTIEATRQVQSREVDLALVNGLIRSPQADSVRQVAPLSVEALHLLVKRELADRVAADLGALKGLSVNVGPPGSETEMVTRAVLGFCDIAIDSSGGREGCRLDRQGIPVLLSKLDELEKASPERVADLRDSLPDVVFHVSTLPSPLARRLIRVGQYGLVPLPFASAFSRITVDEEDLDRDHIDQVHVVQAAIPAYMYGTTPPVPAVDCPTLGCPLILVVHRDVPSQVVARLLPRIYEGPVQRVYHPPEIGEAAATYPLHAASIAYRDRGNPLVRADVVDAVQRGFGILAPLVGGCLALYGYYRWRQTLRFMEYFEQFQALDLQAKGLASDEVVTPAEAEEARRLEAQLTRLQQRAVADFCRNYFHGEGVLENFLQLLAETRGFLRASTQNAPPRDPPPEGPGDSSAGATRGG